MNTTKKCKKKKVQNSLKKKNTMNKLHYEYFNDILFFEYKFTVKNIFLYLDVLYMLNDIIPIIIYKFNESFKKLYIINNNIRNNENIQMIVINQTF